MANMETIQKGNGKATAILQGRMGATRLPGKVMLSLVHKPVIQHVYERVQSCRSIDKVIVATSTLPEDDCIAELFGELQVDVFRGSAEDPLDRYYQAAKEYDSEHVVRIMADCPLVDPTVVDELVESYFAGNYDLFCLVGEFPTGLDVSVFSFSALEQNWNESTLLSEREHIIPYLYKYPERFKTGGLEKFKGLFHHRWVMDYPQDYQFIKAVYEELYNPDQIFLSEDVLALLKRKPFLAKINADIERDSGYKKAVSSDRKMV